MHPWAERLNQAFDKTGWTKRELARRSGVSYDNVNKYLGGKVENPRGDAIEQLANVLGVNGIWIRNGDIFPPETELQLLEVAGISEAGAYRDVSVFYPMHDDTKNQRIPIARDKQYPNARQYALLVSGDSTDRIAPAGAYATCVDFEESGLALRSGMIVHVERLHDGLVETTIKIYREDTGRKWLEPCSTNPRHKRVEITENDNDKINIRGIVTGWWSSIE